MKGNNIPSDTQAKSWAQGLVTKMGDSSSDRLSELFYYEPKSLGSKPTVARERREQHISMRFAVQKIEVVVYPSTKFVTMLDAPDRQWSDVEFDGMAIYLDKPMVMPVLVRVVYARFGSPEVSYTLYSVGNDALELMLDQIDADYEGLTEADVAVIAEQIGLPITKRYIYRRPGDTIPDWHRGARTPSRAVRLPE